jgi:hypothetical protein
LVAGLVRPVPVVVAFVGLEDLTCMSLSHNQDVVEDFGSPPLGR